MSMDVGVALDGYLGDSAVTVCAGGVAADEAKRLMDVTMRSLEEGIAAARAGNWVNNISQSVERAVRPSGFGIVREFVGHGVGKELHEPPEVPNFAQQKRGCRLVPGMVLAIEPMITSGRPDIVVDADGWTARTRDGGLAAHFEHMVLITENGPEILTWQTTPCD